ncbi:MAG: carboxypeptidase-like regulatory domain-containing protein [Proteobacteria bacterium]|nr:carboxypeptidase-like regulatory domain-containing protein [Pseudomonadota bacterium]
MKLPADHRALGASTEASERQFGRVRRWVWLPFALVALWLGICWVGGDGEMVRGSLPGLVQPSKPARGMVFRDGRWVSVDRAEQLALLREMASRTPGLIRVTGTVRDTHSDRTLAGAEVVFANELGESTTVADAGGQYTIEIRGGFYRAFARADGFVAVGTIPAERLPKAPEVSNIGVPRGELAPLIGIFRDQSGVDMQVRRGAMITGTVYDSTGQPIAGAVVTGEMASGYPSRVRLVLGTDMDESDLDGSFRLEVSAGPIEFHAAHPDYAGLAPSSPRRLFLPAGATHHIDLTMARGCIIEGRVVDSRGVPAGEGSLEVGNDQVPPNDFEPVGALDSSGQFRLTRTRSGTIRVRAWPWKSPPTVPTELWCDDGARHDLTLVIPDPDPDLEGTVVGADNEPLAHAYIDLFPLSPGGIVQQERADRYGEWAFHAVPTGDYHVTAYVPGKGIAADIVTAPSRGLRLALSGTGAISGTVQGMRDGSFLFVIEHCMTRVQDGSVVQFDETSMPHVTRLVPVEDGAFFIEDLPACVLRATIRTPYRNQRLDIEIAARKSANLVLDLRQAMAKTIHGTVADADRMPVERVFVSRVPGPGAPLDYSAHATTDGHGRYEIRAFTGDTLYFRSERGRAQAEVSWDDSDSQRIDVTLN